MCVHIFAGETYKGIYVLFANENCHFDEKVIRNVTVFFIHFIVLRFLNLFVR